MNLFKKAVRKLSFCFFTVLSKLKWGDSLNISGLFQRLADTQIIILNGGRINIGANVSFQKRVSLTSGGVLNIGSDVALNRNCILVCRNNITIGSNTMFGPGVTIYDHDHKFNADGIQSELNYGSVIIDNGCWIAANVTILRNTHIGEGSVIGAGTVVKGEIPPHSLVTSDRGLNIVPIRKA